MSKNFEALLRAEGETALFEPVGIPQETTDSGCSSTHIAASVREAELKLVQRVFLLPGCASPRTVVFCAVDHADGTVGICARAAENLANQTLSPVCIVDGSLQCPSLHHYFGVANHRGFTNALFESGPIRDFVHDLPGGNLAFLCAGSRFSESSALWKSERLRSRVAELREDYAYVLIYAPPLIQDMAASFLGQVADGVILVVESEFTRRETARKVKESLAAANVKLLGAVLNNRTFPIPESLYKKL